MQSVVGHMVVLGIVLGIALGIVTPRNPRLGRHHAIPARAGTETTEYLGETAKARGGCCERVAAALISVCKCVRVLYTEQVAS